MNLKKEEILEKHKVFAGEPTLVAMDEYAAQQASELKHEIAKLESDLRDAYKQCDEERESKESLQCYRNELVEDNENWQIAHKKLKDEIEILEAVKFDYDHAEVIKQAYLSRIKELEKSLRNLMDMLPKSIPPDYQEEYNQALQILKTNQ